LSAVRSPDTSPDAEARQLAVYRAMTPARRVELAAEMSEEMFAVAAAGIRARHPEYDDVTVTRAVRRLRVGDDLFRAAWPDAPLVAP
jgi:hypothetical protein